MTDEPLPTPPGQDLENPAVAACCRAWEETYEEALESGDVSEYDATQRANQAFRDAMPPLTGAQNIRNFIACVAAGLLRSVFSGSEGPRLLYAAQIAVSAGSPRRLPGRPKK